MEFLPCRRVFDLTDRCREELGAKSLSLSSTCLLCCRRTQLGLKLCRNNDLSSLHPPDRVCTERPVKLKHMKRDIREGTPSSELELLINSTSVRGCEDGRRYGRAMHQGPQQSQADQSAKRERPTLCIAS
ncbi:unnamed protein product [Pleuronectes platessa]|uniref:Uncharacterized protein n=1 Tax=Pleuronectes platessa TaxID=8262 RepID=A0A9N7YV14_PLEPL|nr:unnamed protein product [Pleuronectes platessa]